MHSISAIEYDIVLQFSMWTHSHQQSMHYLDKRENLTVSGIIIIMSYISSQRVCTKYMYCVCVCVYMYVCTAAVGQCDSCTVERKRYLGNENNNDSS